jgi:hypothetical protein
MKIPRQTIDQWRNSAAAWLAQKGHTLEDLRTGRDAWTVAHHTGITREAYENPSIVDAHIQTALGRIFPNVQFKDPKRY